MADENHNPAPSHHAPPSGNGDPGGPDPGRGALPGAAWVKNGHGAETVVQKRPGGGGAPLGNTNAARHALRGQGWPPGTDRDRRHVLALRRALEAIVLDVKGELDLLDQCSINTACRWERHARLAARWLRLHMSEMTHAERLAYSKATAEASERRDRAIAALRIAETQSDPLAALAAWGVTEAASEPQE
jgi:hypothetical protein